MAGRKPTTAVVTSPDEGEATTPAEGEQTAPDEGEATTPETTEELLARLTSEDAEPVDVTPKVVIMQVTITGSRDGKPWPHPGEEIELPADEADRMVRLGYARPAD